MRQLLLLVNAEGGASVSELIVRELRDYPGEQGVSVHFRPVRNDALFESAKVGSEIAYRVLRGEGLVRSQLWAEYEVRGPHLSVAGRSADLLFALALVVSRWKPIQGEYPAIAATGVLSTDEALVGSDPAQAVAAVAHVEAKVAAAVRALSAERAGVVLYPAADHQRVEAWCAAAHVPAHVRIRPVATLEDALGALGIELEKVYLGNPYRGLEQFEYRHRSVFFGRDGEIRELAAQLVRREAAAAPGVVVEGTSGSGKSSFLRAGILAALVNPRGQSPQLESALADRPVPEAASRMIWHPALSSADADEAALAQSIHRLWKGLPEFADDRAVEITTFAALLRLWRARWPNQRRFVWVLDQLEELFNPDLGEAVIESFGRFLIALQAEGVWSLAAIRTDAMPTLKRHAALRRVFGPNEGQYYLATLGPTALDDVIWRPANVAGLTFGSAPGGKGLDEALREEAYRDHENALPLLQFTLHELYRRRSGRELSYAVYEELGGLSGAVATIASQAMKRASRGAAPTAKRLFRSLVSVDDSGNAMRRYAARSEIAQDPAQEQLVDALVNARLCVSDRRDGHAAVALAHEAVLRAWPELAEWLKLESQLLQLRELAERDARLWQQHACSDTWLAPPGKLAALEPLSAAEIRLSDPVREFIERSRKRARRTARLRQAGMAAAILLAAAASVTGLIALAKQHEAQYEAAEALRARNRASIEAESAHSTADFLAAIFNAPTPARALGRPITAREVLDEGARRLRGGLAAAPEVRARLTEQIGNAYREIGEFGRAAPLLESAIEQYRALAHAPIRDRAQAYTALGQLDQATDRRAGAEKALMRAMALEGQLPPARRSALPNLVYAKVEIDAAQFQAARGALDRAREILHARKHVPDRQDYLLPMRYSQLYLRQGAFAKSVRLALEALATQSRVLGPDDPSAVAVADYVESLYQRMNDVSTAQKYGRQALTLAARIYGENHPMYAQVLGNYAINFGILGERGVGGANRKAEELFRKVLAIRLRTLGPHNSATGDAYYDIANASAARGHWAQALAMIGRARKIWEKSEGSASPQVAWAFDMEARALTRLGRPAAAVPLAEKALRISRQKHIPSYIGKSWQELGTADLALGRYPQAADALSRALGIFRSIFGGAHAMKAGMRDYYARMLGLYADALRGEGRRAAERAALTRIAAIRTGSRPAKGP
jgi:tetratricopeptide (TPR) repeat protein